MSDHAPEEAIREASRLQRQLAGQIARHIRGHNLPVGTPLVEIALADTFKVSRTPIKAALELLAQVGVIDKAERRGFVVAEAPDGAEEALEAGDAREEERLYLAIASDFMSDRLGEPFSEADLMRRYDVGRALLARVLRRMALDLVIERNQGHGWRFAPTFKSAEADADSYRFRMVVEPAALLEPGYSLDRDRAEASRRAHEAILRTPPAQLSPLEFFAVNAEFHELIAAGSRNSFMTQAVQQQNRLRRLLNLQWTYAEERIVQSCREHMAILDAVMAGDLQWASSLMHRHLELASRNQPEADRDPASA